MRHSIKCHTCHLFTKRETAHGRTNRKGEIRYMCDKCYKKKMRLRKRIERKFLFILWGISVLLIIYFASEIYGR